MIEWKVETKLSIPPLPPPPSVWPCDDDPVPPLLYSTLRGEEDIEQSRAEQNRTCTRVVVAYSPPLFESQLLLPIAQRTTMTGFELCVTTVRGVCSPTEEKQYVICTHTHTHAYVHT